MNNRFDTAAETWDEKPDRLEMASKFAHEIRKSIIGKNYKTALEYGCGTGNVSFLLKDYFSEMTLVDTSKGMLEELQRKIDKTGATHFKPVFMDLEKESTDEKYDVIYSLMTLHHVQNIKKLIGEFSKMLTPEGMLIVGDLEKEDGDFHKFPENQDVHFGFEKHYLEKILNDNKLSLTNYQVFHEMERTHTGTPKTYTLFVLSAIRQ